MKNINSFTSLTFICLLLIFACNTENYTNKDLCYYDIVEDNDTCYYDVVDVYLVIDSVSFKDGDSFYYLHFNLFGKYAEKKINFSPRNNYYWKNWISEIRTDCVSSNEFSQGDTLYGQFHRLIKGECSSYVLKVSGFEECLYNNYGFEESCLYDLDSCSDSIYLPPPGGPCNYDIIDAYAVVYCISNESENYFDISYTVFDKYSDKKIVIDNKTSWYGKSTLKKDCISSDEFSIGGTFPLQFWRISPGWACTPEILKLLDYEDCLYGKYGGRIIFY